ncbi:MAG: exodeoxyribonuclease VII large subunit [Methanobrevibacter sp.]|nr:exodeoxyribonuclease VII large subunit [Methanobrevibacter sp.]
MENEYLTVSQLNAYINKKMKFDQNLKNIYVKGEISNFKTYSSGHSYFTLKDKNSQIPAVMFKGRRQFLKFEPKDGMKVIIKGKVEVYERDGKYQLYATTITEDGIGALHIAFEQLKKKLDKEGLFDDAHKKEIPSYPQRIGVVTASTGAAVKDIIQTIKGRYPYCEVLVFSTLVQGDLAAPQIVRQINHAQKYDIDTLIVGRGGGSIEDLWPFNEEIVARAIYDCKIPVISAVGHEVDFTISDFVADARAPTPTGAAVLAVPDINEVQYKLKQLTDRLNKNINDKITDNKTRLNNISQKQIFKNPESIYEIKGMTLDNLINKLEFTSKNIIAENRNKLFKLENKNILKNPEEITKLKKEVFLRHVAKLEVLNPLITLKRGYTLTKVEGKIVSSAKEVKSGDKLDVEFEDGTVNTKVI